MLQAGEFLMTPHDMRAAGYLGTCFVEEAEVANGSATINLQELITYKFGTHYAPAEQLAFHFNFQI